MNKYRYRAITKIIRVIESCVTIEQLEVALKMLENYSNSRPTDDYDCYDYLHPVYINKEEELRRKLENESK